MTLTINSDNEAISVIGRLFSRTDIDASIERERGTLIKSETNFLRGCLLITNEVAVHILKNRLKSRSPNIYGISDAMLKWSLRMSGVYMIMKRRRKRW